MSVVIGWQIYSITHSSYALGFVGLAQFVPMFVPMFVLTLIVGHVADRYDRRTIAYVCQAIKGVGALCLCLVAWHGWSSVMPIYAIAVVTGAPRAGVRIAIDGGAFAESDSALAIAAGDGVGHLGKSDRDDSRSRDGRLALRLRHADRLWRGDGRVSGGGIRGGIDQN